MKSKEAVTLRMKRMCCTKLLKHATGKCCLSKGRFQLPGFFPPRLRNKTKRQLHLLQLTPTTSRISCWSLYDTTWKLLLCRLTSIRQLETARNGLKLTYPCCTQPNRLTAFGPLQWIDPPFSLNVSLVELLLLPKLIFERQLVVSGPLLLLPLLSTSLFGPSFPGFHTLIHLPYPRGPSLSKD